MISPQSIPNENQFTSSKKQVQLPPLVKSVNRSVNEETESVHDGRERNLQLQPIKQRQSSSNINEGSRIISSQPFHPKSSVNNKFVQPATFSDKSTWICYFCGGRTCKKERADCNPYENAIEGLHSDWITDNILAMQRPSTGLIQKHNIISQFKNSLIGGVLNLQEPGEHPSCGPGLIAGSGFTYSPEEFQKNHIFFFNYGWEDMEITTFEHLIKIMSAFSFVFSKGQKMAVHCHAGTGRTGVAIVAWLIYGEGMSAVDAISLFQQKRASSLGKSAQQNLLKKFELYLTHHRKCFDFPRIPILKIGDLVERQNKVLFGKQKSEAKHLPIVMQVVFSKLKDLVEANQMTAKEVLACFFDLENKQFFNQNWSLVFEDELTKLKEKFNNHCFELGQVSDPRIYCQILLDYFDKIPSAAIKDDISSQLNEKLQQNQPLEQIFTDSSTVKLLGTYQFELMGATAKFISFLFEKEEDCKDEIYKFLVRLSMSFLQKKKYMDKCFYKRSIFNFELVQMQAITNLAEVILAWMNMYLNTQKSPQEFTNQYMNLTNSIVNQEVSSNMTSRKKGQIVPL